MAAHTHTHTHNTVRQVRTSMKAISESHNTPARTHNFGTVACARHWPPTKTESSSASGRKKRAGRLLCIRPNGGGAPRAPGGGQSSLLPLVGALGHGAPEQGLGLLQQRALHCGEGLFVVQSGGLPVAHDGVELPTEDVLPGEVLVGLVGGHPLRHVINGLLHRVGEGGGGHAAQGLRDAPPVPLLPQIVRLRPVLMDPCPASANPPPPRGRQ